MIAIGDELLRGRTADTNFVYLAQRLHSAGIDVACHMTVGDGEDEIVDALRSATERSDLVVVTGGLGVTPDDRTRQALARLTGARLIPDRELSREIEVWFRDRSIRMPSLNMAQSLLPEGARKIPNPAGLAPGIHIKVNGCDLFSFPGVPAELGALTEEALIPFVEKEMGGTPPLERELRTWGMGETRVAEKVGLLVKREKLLKVSYLPEDRGVTVRLRWTGGRGEEEAARLNAVTEEMCDIIGNAIYSTREEELEEVTAYLLALYRKTIAVAESCTGGLLSAYLTSIPGSSTFFREGTVPYFAGAKVDRLGLKQELIDREGTVSGAVAEELARAARRQAGTDIGVGITGIAGPEKVEGKPIGLVFAAIDTAEGTIMKEWIIPGERRRVRERAARNALNLVRLYLIRALG